jgi:hypothetical protein
MNTSTWKIGLATVTFAIAVIHGADATARGATNACRATAQAAGGSCRAEARADRLNAEGVCANLLDPAAVKPCKSQAATDSKSTLQDCREQDTLRKDACAKLGPAPYVPVIDPANFTNSTTIDNPYYPLPLGKTFVYEGTVTEEPAGFEHVDFIVTHVTRVIQGVTCVEVHDKRFLNGKLLEDTRDWFAQDNSGNVWYFGENTTLVDERGLPVDLAGTWTGGVDGAQPGIIMEAHPAVGDFYRQEFLLGEAEDVAEVTSFTETVAVPYPPGSFPSALKITESAPIAPGDVSPKYYALGVGNLLTVEPNGDRSELIRIESNME